MKPLEILTTVYCGTGCKYGIAFKTNLPFTLVPSRLVYVCDALNFFATSTYPSRSFINVSLLTIESTKNRDNL